MVAKSDLVYSGSGSSIDVYHTIVSSRIKTGMAFDHMVKPASPVQHAKEVLSWERF